MASPASPADRRRPPPQNSQALHLPTGESLYLWISHGYPRIRPYSNKQLHPASTYSVFRLLLHLAWGPSTPYRSKACHFCCDIHGCCNPLHGRWGTQEQNKAEDKLLRAWRATYLPLPEEERRQVTHPAATAFDVQGMVWLPG